jgi:hypothetical protein
MALVKISYRMGGDNDEFILHQPISPYGVLLYATLLFG